MQQKLLSYFESIEKLTQEETAAIAATIEIKSFEKECILLAEGQVSKKAYFVIEGCVRQFYTVNGEERISDFFTANQWVTSLASFRENIPSKHSLVCSTPCLLVVGNREKELELYQKYPKLESISRQIMEKILTEQQEKWRTVWTDSPEERYQNLLSERPELFQLLPQYQIASYLGIKPESLSRIRKRLAK